MSNSSRPPLDPTRVLILGGSNEATVVARALAGRAEIAPVLSLAGRTLSPVAQPIATRIGGFGGVEGLLRYLREERVDILVDATHPFASQMSAHAREAARRAGRRLLRISRASWRPQAGDRWTDVADMAAAAEAIGAAPRRVFLTVGSLQLEAFARAPQHHYLVRTIDPVGAHGLSDAAFITSRGPFDPAEEERLMRRHRIDVLVTKNSGGTRTAAKLAAARSLAMPVILVRRPAADAGALTVEDALVVIEAHCAAPRGV